MTNAACHRNNTRITFAIVDANGCELFTLTEDTNTARLLSGNGMRVAMFNALDVYVDANCPYPGADRHDVDTWKAEAQGSIVVKATNRASVSAVFAGTSAALLDVFPGMDDAEAIRFYA